LPVNRVYRQDPCRSLHVTAEICKKTLPWLKYFARTSAKNGVRRTMGNFVDYVPIAATAFAIPQFLPQILKLRVTHDTAGVSWSWSMLTSINNAAWLTYFALSGYWIALVPSSSATLLAGTLAVMLTMRGQAALRPAALIGTWAGCLIIGV